MSKFQDTISRALKAISDSKTSAELYNAMSQFSIHIGAEYFQTIPGPYFSMPNNEVVLEIGNFPLNLKTTYSDERTAHNDPIRRIAILGYEVILWRKISLKIKSIHDREFISSLRHNNLIDGVSIPLHAPNGCFAILMFASSKHLYFEDNLIDNLQLIAVSLLQKIKHIEAVKLIQKPIEFNLTDREIECLEWVLEGKTNWEIGILMGITPRTVQFHIANCARKFGVSNRVQTAVKALVAGIIKPKTYKQETIFKEEYFIQTKQSGINNLNFHNG